MVMCNLLTIGDDILMLLMLIVMVGIILSNLITCHLHKKQLATLADYFNSKSEKARRFAAKEEDEKEEDEFNW